MTDTDFKFLHSLKDIEDVKIRTEEQIVFLIGRVEKARDKYDDLKKCLVDLRYNLCMLRRRRQDICEHMVTKDSITYGYLFATCIDCKKIVAMVKVEKEEKEETCLTPTT